MESKWKYKLNKLETVHFQIAFIALHNEQLFGTHSLRSTYTVLEMPQTPFPPPQKKMHRLLKVFSYVQLKKIIRLPPEFLPVLGPLTW